MANARSASQSIGGERQLVHQDSIDDMEDTHNQATSDGVGERYAEQRVPSVYSAASERETELVRAGPYARIYYIPLQLMLQRYR